MKTSDLPIKALENEGIRDIYGISGEDNLDVLDSLSRSSIELILTRHEQAAGFMPATYGRLTGETGVCLSTLGPGATRLPPQLLQSSAACRRSCWPVRSPTARASRDDSRSSTWSN